MLAILIVILVLLWAAVVWSIYSNFLVFYSNFSETENYHKAYYASISALERAELVTKQRQPWYAWSGGFVKWDWTWSTNNTDWWSDSSLSGFSYYWNDKNDTTVFRDINSRTTRIPAEWKWDVERMLSYNSNDSENSNNYNMMDYENSEVFLLYYDISQGNPYKNGSTEGSNPTQITWEIRLPKQLSGFWELDEKVSLVWARWNMPENDAVVDWQIRWTYNEKPFTIYSTQSVEFDGNSAKINVGKDTVFRESDINKTLKFNFWWSSMWSPFSYDNTFSYDNRWTTSHITMVHESEISAETKSGFKSFFANQNVKLSQIRFSLLNLLQWSGNNIYPFLEYYIDFGGKTVPDKYFTINAEWEYKDYKVDIVVKKPTVKDTVFWSFTSIF